MKKFLDALCWNTHIFSYSEATFQAYFKQENVIAVNSFQLLGRNLSLEVLNHIRV